MITIEPPSTRSSSIAPAKPGLTRYLRRAQKMVGLEGEVDVLLTSDEEIKRLNRTFRKKNKATDVLSFPAPEELAGEHAGDLAISLDTAAQQAESFGHSLVEEIRILLLHGLLHLSGMDHEVDAGEMAEREAELRTELKLPGSLIERVSRPPSRMRSAVSPRRRS
ncbi:rRNA maturation RNase YbeY [Edaphobacter sp. HDX4]|uniref:rRNA maturation RNase YbeY n=1 Tax=Edaphobacter sp. HDX4 TaxID=2794064 RepID=UPI002FE6C238